jgi:hypothetical protein
LYLSRMNRRLHVVQVVEDALARATNLHHVPPGDGLLPEGPSPSLHSLCASPCTVFVPPIYPYAFRYKMRLQPTGASTSCYKAAPPPLYLLGSVLFCSLVADPSSRPPPPAIHFRMPSTFQYLNPHTFLFVASPAQLPLSRPAGTAAPTCHAFLHISLPLIHSAMMAHQVQ